MTGAPALEKMAFTECACSVKNSCRGSADSYAFKYWNLFEVKNCSPNIAKPDGFLKSSTCGNWTAK